MSWTLDNLDYIQHMDFLDDLLGVLDDSSYRGSDWEYVQLIVPRTIGETYSEIVRLVLDEAETLPIEELEFIIRELSPGYLRMELRTIWRQRTGNP